MTRIRDSMRAGTTSYFMSDLTKNYSNYILLLAERIETRGERHRELIMNVY